MFGVCVCVVAKYTLNKLQRQPSFSLPSRPQGVKVLALTPAGGKVILNECSHASGEGQLRT